MEITTEHIREAAGLLELYRRGKASLERRIVENERWWRLRAGAGNESEGKPEVASAWLLNCVLSKHADAMDSFPSANILPRESGDTEEAKNLSAVLPVILEQNRFEKLWSDLWWYKLKNGAAAYGVFWNRKLHDGLGDIDLRRIDLLNLFWEPGITDLQESENIFCVEAVSRSALSRRYPGVEFGKSARPLTADYNRDDSVTGERLLVVDWYYKRRRGSRDIVHYCKFVNETILFATENLPEYFDTGLYSHGKYPFVIDVLYPEEAGITGFGIVDICRSPQSYIDKLDSAILKNALMSATPRYFIRGNGSVNEEEFADWSRDFVHTGIDLASDSISQIRVNELPSSCMSVLASKITELKETSGNRDVQNGGTAAGVTAASAIAALQEQSGKLSRDMIKASYRAFREALYICVELIREFYTIPRFFRVRGESGIEFLNYCNKGLLPRPLPFFFSGEPALRSPVFDIEISAEKESAYSRISHNELMLQLYSLGCFDPAMADRAIPLLSSLDFDGRDSLLEKLTANASLARENERLNAYVSQLEERQGNYGTNLFLSGDPNAEVRERAALSTRP